MVQFIGCLLLYCISIFGMNSTEVESEAIYRGELKKTFSDYQVLLDYQDEELAIKTDCMLLDTIAYSNPIYSASLFYQKQLEHSWTCRDDSWPAANISAQLLFHALDLCFRAGQTGLQFEEDKYHLTLKVPNRCIRIPTDGATITANTSIVCNGESIVARSYASGTYSAIHITPYLLKMMHRIRSNQVTFIQSSQ